ncbi:hypothetical protein M0812_15839 [Anaeramoeba flamelloides]|uniref:Uncharacterized protein n=1 Tax=Anaeramoeba flamelloides TaxID=1746091 RepID=A0AAV7ZCZ1_9EUKA|nr:hypothetical protein M0812_15839 [Anaeramoeba flamelloides]
MNSPLRDPQQENTQETKQMKEPKQQFINELPINNQQQNLQLPLFYPTNMDKKRRKFGQQNRENNKEEKKEQNNREKNKSENGYNKETETQKEELSLNSFKITKITNQNLYEDSDESEISCSSDNEDGNLNIPFKSFKSEEEKVHKKRQVGSFEIKEDSNQIQKEGITRIKNENKEFQEKEIIHKEEKNQTKLIPNNSIFFNPNLTNNGTTNNQKLEKDQKSKNSSEYNSFSNVNKNTNINTNVTPNITNKINNSQNETVLKDKINSNSESNLSISSDSESLSLSISELDSEPEYIPKLKNENPQSTFFEKTNIAKGFPDLPELMNKKVIDEKQTQTQTETQTQIGTLTNNSTKNVEISKTTNDPKQSQVISGERFEGKITINIDSSELKNLNIATDDESEISEGDVNDTSSDDYYINSEKRSTASSEITSIKNKKKH